MINFLYTHVRARNTFIIVLISTLFVAPKFTYAKNPCDRFVSDPNAQAACENIYTNCAGNSAGSNCEQSAIQTGVTSRTLDICASSGANNQATCQNQGQQASQAVQQCFTNGGTSDQCEHPVSAVTTTYQCPTDQPNCNLNYQPLEKVPGFPTDGVKSPEDFVKVIQILFKFLIAFGALFAAVTLTVYGVLYMTSEVAGNKQRAIERMKSSLWGLILLLASVVILQQINPQLLTIDLSSLTKLGNCANGQCSSQ